MIPYRHPDPAVRREMARIRRSRPRYGYDARRARPAAGIDWAALRRRAWEIFIMYVLIADVGLLMIAARGAQPVHMTFPAATVTAPAPPHPATPTGHH